LVGPGYALVDLFLVAAGLECLPQSGLVVAGFGAEADEHVRLTDVLEVGGVGAKERAVERREALVAALLRGILRRLERQVGVRGEGAAASELDARSLATFLKRALRAIGRGLRRALAAFGRN